MNAKNTAQLTLSELTTLIEQIVEQKLNSSSISQTPINPQYLKTLFNSIDNHLWTPPKNTPSTLELLRQDRDQ